MGDKTPPPTNSNIVPESQLPTVLLSPKKTVVDLKDYEGKKLFGEFKNESSDSDSDSDSVDSNASTVIFEPSEEEIAKAEAVKAYRELPFETKIELIKRKLNTGNKMYDDIVAETGQMNFSLPKKLKGSEGGRRSKKRNKKIKKRKTKKNKKRKTKKNKKRKSKKNKKRKSKRK